MSTHHSTSTDAGLEFWGSLSSSIVLANARLQGDAVTAAIEEVALLRTIAQHADLLEPAPSDAPGPQVAAIQAAQWSTLNGRKVRAFTDADGHAHVIDFPPSQIADGPYESSASIAALSTRVTDAWSTARADSLLASLGNPPVQWIQTHSQGDGDPIDAGYFTTAGTGPNLQSSERTHSSPLQLRTGAGSRQLPTPPPAPSTVVRCLHHDRLVNRIRATADTLGPDTAREVVGLATRLVLAARWEWMRDLDDNAPPALAAASRYRRALQWLDTPVTLTPHAPHDAVVLEESSNAWSRLNDALPTFRSTWIEAWSTASRSSHINLSATERSDTRPGIVFSLREL